jgi:hypothetical protein
MCAEGCWLHLQSGITYVESLLSVAIGIGLAASCGFRVFVPLLVVSIASHYGYLDLAENFGWLGSWPALLAFLAASLVETMAYYLPWVDNLLDSIATPLAVAAGVLLFAANVGGFDPFWQWSLAIIAGGGSAAVVQGGTVATRAASTLSSGGLANFIVATLETLAGLVFSLLSLVVPVLAVILIAVVAGGMYYFGRRILRKLISPS